MTQEELKGLYNSLRTKMKRKWGRDLPFDELLFNRWDRAENLGFGKGASIYHNSYVYGDVTVGEHTWIGPFTILDGTGVLNIGSYCSISAGVQIYTHDSVDWAISGGKAEYEKSPTIIGNNCYIGPNAVITKGVTIGDGCVIGANSLINGNVPSGSRAFGSPYKIDGGEK